MKHTKRYLLAAMIAFVSTNTVAESILDIHQLALENDPQLKADTAAYAAGIENRTIGRAGLLPQINATGTYNTSESETVSHLVEGVAASGVTTDSDSDTKSWGVTLQQPLLDLSAWHTYKSGVALSDQATAQFAADQQDLIVRVTNAYFNVLRQVDNLRATRAEKEALEQQLEQTRQRFEVGLTPITGVHEAQAAYDSAVAQALQARGNVAISFEALEVLTGKSHDTIAQLQEDFPVVQPVPASRHDWVEFALKNNYALKAAKHNAQAATQNAKASKANHYPTVTASASYNKSDNENGVNDYRWNEFDSEGHAIGVTLSVPLFSGLRTSGLRRQAYAQSMQAQEIYNATERNVIQSTRSLHLAVQTGVARVKARRQAIISNESAVQATQSGFEVGTRNLVEVLQAQRALYQARRDYSNALYDYVSNMIGLRETAGMLTPENLVGIDNFLNKNTLIKLSDYEL